MFSYIIAHPWQDSMKKCGESADLGNEKTEQILCNISKMNIICE